MYRARLVATPTHTDNARDLQQQLLAYHQFRARKRDHPQARALDALTRWQRHRLTHTHADLYRDPQYHAGLDFLLSDLYAPTGMSARDDHIDRVFPKLVKWLPDPLLGTLARLVELNLLTQQLDLRLSVTLAELGYQLSSLSPHQYCTAFNAMGDMPARRHQLALVMTSGQQLDRYVRNRTLGWMLSVTRKPAQRADLGELHAFLQRGYLAFRGMAEVDQLIMRLTSREQRILEQITSGHPDPFQIPPEQ
ncbi:FFLEELY motif protein [Marinobacter sp. X15-166B]|uniref:FFLEELY motif protein n=1 Tax=Marinobacter sp. X15-166B TaxID=1897620 RepID=UPI00085C052A|nr:hypothetical protein [Marinobacter sp. X15-166B]OEY65657.1 hypothetical protein BG841_03760 [Marinobacter sp. X15-166B]